MKRLLVIIIALSAAGILNAGNPHAREYKKFTCGAEWNYISSFHYIIHHNFFSDVGYRVDLKENGVGCKSNADVYVHLGYNLSQKWNISIYTGVAGVYDINKIVPFSLRVTRYFRPDNQGDRWFSFIDGGSGISLTRHPQAVAAAKAGAGYRIALSNASKLDFLLMYRMTLTHPELEFDGYEVPINMINRNNVYVSAISIGMSLTF